MELRGVTEFRAKYGMDDGVMMDDGCIICGYSTVIDYVGFGSLSLSVRECTNNNVTANCKLQAKGQGRTRAATNEHTLEKLESRKPTVHTVRRPTTGRKAFQSDSTVYSTVAEQRTAALGLAIVLYLLQYSREAGN